MKKFCPALVLPLLGIATAGLAAESAPRLEARDKLYHYLYLNAEEQKDPAVVRNLLSSYRWKKGEKAVLPVQQGPFPRLLLALVLSDAEVYSQLYSSQYNQLTQNPGYEQLYDAFLGLKVSGNLPESIREDAKKLSLGMARKAQRGKSPSCKLDESDRIVKVGKGTLLKLALGFGGNCETRRAIFNLVKKPLRDVKQNLASLRLYREEKGSDPCAGPAVAAADFATACGVIAEVNKDYGHLFREGLGASLGELVEQFPKLVAKKFGGTDHPIWSAAGSIIDGVEDQAILGDGQVVQLRSFARGMRVDLQAAKVLMQSTVPNDRALAGGLFYSVLNRMIYFVGGNVVKKDAEGNLDFVDNSDTTTDSSGARVRVPEPAPLDERGLLKPIYHKQVDGAGRVISEQLDVKPIRFNTEPIGGFGVNRTKNVISMSPWDPAAYDPDAEDPKLRTPYRLIPTRLRIGANGLTSVIDPLGDLVQKNEDLAEIGLAVAEFVMETKPAGAFGKFFGPQDKMGDLTDLNRTMLVPDVGRILPIAILGIMAQNALHPTLGHVKQLTSGPMLAFQDEATFDDVATRDIDANGVAAVLTACHDLREALRADPIFEQPLLKGLKEEARNLEGVLQLGVLIYGAQLQEPGTGRFFQKMYATGQAEHTLDGQINSILVFLKAYNQAHLSAFTRVRLADGLKALYPEISAAGARALSEDQLFRLSMIWRLSQIYLRSDWADLPWGQWEPIFREIERELEHRL